MQKQWLAMLSVLGLAGSAVRVQSQVPKGPNPIKGSQKTTNTKPVKNNQSIVSPRDPATGSKLQVNQQTLRQQNQGGAAGGKNAIPKPYTGGVKANNDRLTKGQNDAALTTKAGGSNSLTKAKNNAALTKGTANNQLTKAKNNAALTKASANNQLTKAKNNTALTKAKTGQQ